MGAGSVTAIEVTVSGGSVGRGMEVEGGVAVNSGVGEGVADAVGVTVGVGVSVGVGVGVAVGCTSVSVTRASAVTGSCASV